MSSLPRLKRALPAYAEHRKEFSPDTAITPRDDRKVILIDIGLERVGNKSASVRRLR